MRLPLQVFVARHGKPDPARLEAVTLTEQFHWKPAGGLWTSTAGEEGSAWQQWLDDNGYGPEDERFGGMPWLLVPTEANVAVIADPDDLSRFLVRYPHPRREALGDLTAMRALLDWVAMADDFDAVHFPDPRRWKWTDDMAASIFFDVMDAECTLWFRWCFVGEPGLLID